MTPKARAEKVTATMMEHDKASNWLGVEVQETGEGRSVLTLEVKEHHLNGHYICHGGFIFTLADSAFAFSCNTYDERTVAQHCSVTFIAPAMRGELLTATGREVSRTGRSGIYDITVTTADGKRIAEFRGHSRTIGGSIINPDK